MSKGKKFFPTITIRTTLKNINLATDDFMLNFDLSIVDYFIIIVL
jgi:hypothetical protein